MTDYICIGVPFWLGERLSNRTEVETVKQSGIAQELGTEWIDITPDFDAVDNPVVAVNRALAEAIQSHPDKTPLVFASDCTSCLGMMKGLEAHQPAILWFDAHGDFNTPETSPSGFLGGMPLAALVGRGNQDLMDGVGLSPIAEADVVITDVRNLDEEEAVQLHNSDVTIVEQIGDLASTAFPQKPLYIHFDTDVIDSAEMPAMNYPEPNGPSLAESADVLGQITKQENVVGILFSLWNDTLPDADKALSALLRLVRTLKN